MTDRCSETVLMFSGHHDRRELEPGHRGPHETTWWGPTVHWTANSIRLAEEVDA